MRRLALFLLFATVITACAQSNINEPQKDEGVKMEKSNKEKVVELLKSIETGASEPIAYINPDKYIQHNQSVKDGLAGFGELLGQLPEGSAKVNTVRVIEDGNYVIAHSVYEFFGPKVGIDIFRFEDGLAGLGEALTALAEAGTPMIYEKNHIILGEGNFVLSVSEGIFMKEKVAFYDIFRIENGKVVEHWDVIEKILPDSDAKNSNGKFNF